MAGVKQREGWVHLVLEELGLCILTVAGGVIRRLERQEQEYGLE